MSDGHTAECHESKEKQMEVRAAWIEKHPHACAKCEGTGNGGSAGTVQYWGALISLPDEYCPACIEHGICPLCFQFLPMTDEQFEAWLESEDPCPLCGERFGEQNSMPCVECICFMS